LVILAEYYSDAQIKKYTMGGKSYMREGDEKIIQGSVGARTIWKTLREHKMSLTGIKW
jgi:hypothetical protein